MTALIGFLSEHPLWFIAGTLCAGYLLTAAGAVVVFGMGAALAEELEQPRLRLVQGGGK